jgi:hypothetical protein
MWGERNQEARNPARQDGSSESIATIAKELECEYRFCVDHARVALFLLGVAPGNEAVSELRSLFVDWGDADWRHLAEVADQEIMLSWITHRLMFDPLGCPDDVLWEMQTKSNLRRRWNRVIGLAAIDLWKKLNDACVHTTILKGAPLSLVCYGKEDLRDVRDIDLLVSPADAFRAGQVLMDNGYRCSIDIEHLKNARLLRSARQISLRSMAGALEVDLHWKVTNDWVSSPLNNLAPRNYPSDISVFGYQVQWLSQSAMVAFVKANLVGSHSIECKAAVDYIRITEKLGTSLFGAPKPTSQTSASDTVRAICAHVQRVSLLPDTFSAQDLFSVNRYVARRTSVWFRHMMRVRTPSEALALFRAATTPKHLWLATSHRVSHDR